MPACDASHLSAHICPSPPTTTTTAAATATTTTTSTTTCHVQELRLEREAKAALPSKEAGVNQFRHYMLPVFRCLWRVR